MNNELFRFILVGIFNTILGVSTMFCFYNFFGLGYWGSSALSYTFGSIISFFLNKSFTFKNNDSYVSTSIKFAVNIGVCYFVAYLIAKPFVRFLLSSIGYSFSSKMIEQIAMLVGMVIFTGLNFIGQKVFVFNKEDHIYEE
ncbi:Putative flippase GtrA (transmembrane translocase of bactoprenol-linked glucose) [Desulfonispora thiosulfatigenes DSM 11270]|uniref:Putative flippase GtrA (Transmembrane translocase of bactoprenol-linked glucose) n=1 Tax=Desulfonispora thiosulfatigenes DSM 11270 TaxID=656914 RepID=A0A1W1UIG6_DESTI|nr:GtrA family protein [Desulfonispora thiosulfatigenes]SMB80896.1 Putative flippase GtrA (transmembrane translocase of bactoprenol-linked glucose) [Desulfonispora thiosulfatigenes DSM 11270]